MSFLYAVRRTVLVVLLIGIAPLLARSGDAPATVQLKLASFDLRPYVRIAIYGTVERFKDPVVVNNEVKSLGTLVRTENREYASGSGTIVTPDGLIVTNHHVIADSFGPVTVHDEEQKILVRATPIKILVGTIDPLDIEGPVEDRYIAETVVYHKAPDIALLRIRKDAATGAAVTRRDFAYTPLGNPYAIPMLEDLVVFGYPGLGGRAINPSIGKFQGFTWGVRGIRNGSVKTNAQIAPGNSGGAAVFNNQLVAIPTRVSGPEEVGSDFGYLHPVTWAAEMFAYAKLKFDAAMPRLEQSWVENRNNLEPARRMSFIGGQVVSGQSQLAVSNATVVTYRADRTLEQIGQMARAWNEWMDALDVQDLTEEGWTEERIAARLKLTLAQVHAYKSMTIDKSKLPPDLQAYDRGEYFFEEDDTDREGFFFVQAPRRQAVRIAVIKEGFRIYDGHLPAISTLDYHAGRFQIFMQ